MRREHPPSSAHTQREPPRARSPATTFPARSPQTMAKAKAKSAPAARAGIHTEEQKESVKTAREVIKCHKAKIGGGDVVKRMGMTLKEADAVMAAWRARVEANKK